MSTTQDQRRVTASDGLTARVSGSWAEVKLAFLDHFCPAAIQATARKQHRYYVDLFAGSGMNVVKAGGSEFEGSPLRVLKYGGSIRTELSFTHAVFVNADRRDHRALTSRVDRVVQAGENRVPSNAISLVHGDANRVLPDILEQIPVRAYVFVFVDLENPKQWPWKSTKDLRGHGHRSVDLYMLFPLDMALMRLFSYAEKRRETYARALTTFFGTDAWRDLATRRPTDAQSAQLRQAIIELYLQQLRTLWREAGPIVDVYLRGHQRLYKMLFASDHPAGTRIAEWVRERKRVDGQTELFG